MAEERALQLTPQEVALAVSTHAARLLTKMAQIDGHPEWPLLSRIPMRLTAGIVLPRFKVRDLLALRVESVVETKAPSTSDVPLNCGDLQIGWAEFEVVEQRLAVRVTRLA